MKSRQIADLFAAAIIEQMECDPKPGTICWVATMATLVGCNPNPRETQISARVLSPAKTMEAVSAEDLSGGPATGVSEDVYVVPPGNFPRLVDRVFSNECVRDIHIRWLDRRTLEISYSVPRGIHEDTSRAPPNNWWAPWLWGASPSRSVRVLLRRAVLPVNGC